MLKWQPEYSADLLLMWLKRASRIFFPLAKHRIIDKFDKSVNFTWKTISDGCGADSEQREYQREI